jgi:conjugative transfer region protein TrbK
MRALTARGWGTVAAIAVLIAVVIAAVASSIAGGQRTAPAPAQTSLDTALSHCRDLGVAAENDADCHETWRRLRDHFLGEDRKGERP